MPIADLLVVVIEHHPIGPLLERALDDPRDWNGCQLHRRAGRDLRRPLAQRTFDAVLDAAEDPHDQAAAVGVGVATAAAIVAASAASAGTVVDTVSL